MAPCKTTISSNRTKTTLSSSSTTPLYSLTVSETVGNDHYQSTMAHCKTTTTPLTARTTSTLSSKIPSTIPSTTASSSSSTNPLSVSSVNSLTTRAPAVEDAKMIDNIAISTHTKPILLPMSIPRQANGRALRRRRTVAFAVNHEKLVARVNARSQPSIATVSTPNFQKYSGARLSLGVTSTTHDTVNKSVHSQSITNQNSTVQSSSTCQQDGMRAIENSYVCRDSSPDVQQQDASSQRHDHVRSTTTSTTTTTTGDVRSTPLSIAMPTTAFRSNVIGNGPAPITPVNNNVGTTAVTIQPTIQIPIKRKRGRPSKKSKMIAATMASSCQTCVVSGASTARVILSPPPQPQPKIHRVKYDMESVPQVQLNMETWNQFRQQFQAKNYLSRSATTIAATTATTTTTATTVSPISLPKPILSLSSSSSSELLSESVLWIPPSRKEWEDSISELKSVCTSAAYRRWFKDQTTRTQTNNNGNLINNINNNTNANVTAMTMIPTSVTSNVNVNPKAAAKNLLATNTNTNTNSVFHQPMSQAFIKDRIKYDDPLRGYQIRHATGGWLQGFIIYTTMNLWTQEFQWNSTHPTCCLPAEIEKELMSSSGSSSSSRIDDGTLSTELEALDKSDPDPIDGGIVLHGVAEISLLGGLGCGEILLRKAIEDIRSSDQNYKYIVMQATTGSRPFYEKYGFKRVGAVCRYRWSGGNGYGANTTGTMNAGSTKNSTTKNTADHGDSIVPDGVISAPSTDTTPKIPHGEIQGYRHWTYTNESAISLDLHGGPSIMMCLRLSDLDAVTLNETVSKTNVQTISDLLAPHVVKEKPTIKPLGNVQNSNPNGSDEIPTRKSSRSRAGKGKCQPQLQNNDVAVVDLTGAATTTATTTTRTSKRSKRGRKSAFHNSDYVVYGDGSSSSSSLTSVTSFVQQPKQQQEQQQQSQGGSNNSIMKTDAKISTSTSTINKNKNTINNAKRPRYIREEISIEGISFPKAPVLQTSSILPQSSKPLTSEHPLKSGNDSKTKNSKIYVCNKDADVLSSSSFSSQSEPASVEPLTNLSRPSIVKKNTEQKNSIDAIASLPSSLSSSSLPNATITVPSNPIMKKNTNASSSSSTTTTVPSNSIMKKITNTSSSPSTTTTVLSNSIMKKITNTSSLPSTAMTVPSNSIMKKNTNTSSSSSSPSTAMTVPSINKNKNGYNEDAAITPLSSTIVSMAKPKRDGNGRFINDKKDKRKKRQQGKGQNNNSINNENLTTGTVITNTTIVTPQENTSLASVVAAATVNALAVIHNNSNSPKCNNNNKNAKKNVKTLTDGNKIVLNDRPRRQESVSLSSSSLYDNENTVTTNTTTTKDISTQITSDSSSSSSTAKSPTTEPSSSKVNKTKSTKKTMMPKRNDKKKRKIDSLVKSLSTTLPSASSWQKQASTYLESSSCDSVVVGGGNGKRLRQSFIDIDKTKLCKQKVKSYPRSRIHYYNKVVIRKRSSNVIDDDPRGGGNANSRIPRRYNGGSMIDHRYEYCFYFVLHYDEPTSKIILVPMIRNGLFMSGSKKRVGRFRYQCNILDNNKNWIVDADTISEEYDVVLDATMIMKTSLVAQEAWDIYSNEEEAGYDE